MYSCKKKNRKRHAGEKNKKNRKTGEKNSAGALWLESDKVKSGEREAVTHMATTTTTTKRTVRAEQPMKVAKQRFLKQAHIEKKERVQAKFNGLWATAKVVHDTRMGRARA